MYFRVMLSVSCMLMYAGIVHAAPFAYIANKAGNTVSVVDTASNAVTATIPVGQSPYGVAVNSIGGRAYVSNQNSKTISVIDTMDNSVTTIPASGMLTKQPGGLAVNSAGTRLFVADNDGTTVSVFDTATGNKLGSRDLGLTGNAQPDGVAVGPVVGGVYKVYVTCFGTNQVMVVTASDATDPAVINAWPLVSVTVGTTPLPNPKGVAVSTDGSMVFVANMDENTVSVINGSTNAIIGTPVAVGNTPFGLAVTPNGTKVYVANSNTVNIPYTVTVININTTAKTVIDTSTINLTNGQMPMGIAVTADGAKVVTANSYGDPGSASTINVSDNSLVPAAKNVGQEPVSLGKFAGPFLYDVTSTVTTTSWFGLGGKITPPLGIVTMSPQGIVKVGAGQNLTLSIIPENGAASNQPNFVISDVKVGSTNPPTTSVGAVSSYTFSNVTAPQYISASFIRTKWDFKASFSGLGTGTIKSSVGGIDCGTTCSAAIAPTPQIIFTYTKTADSTGGPLVSWGGACAAAGNNSQCELVLDDANALLLADNNGVFNVIAIVGAPPPPTPGGPVRTARTGTIPYYPALQDAYIAASSGTVIDAQVGPFSFTANLAKNVTLVGGWTNWTTLPAGSATTITNGLTISQGSVTIGSYLGNGTVIVQ